MAKQKSVKTVPLSILRQAKGLTQVDLADELKVSRGLIGLYESGKRKPRLDRALQIANYFDVPIEMIQFDCRQAK